MQPRAYSQRPVPKNIAEISEANLGEQQNIPPPNSQPRPRAPAPPPTPSEMPDHVPFLECGGLPPLFPPSAGKPLSPSRNLRRLVPSSLRPLRSLRTLR